LIDRLIEQDKKKRECLGIRHSFPQGKANTNQGHARITEFDQREFDLIRSGGLVFFLNLIFFICTCK
jgi:hypothetical protein